MLKITVLKNLKIFFFTEFLAPRLGQIKTKKNPNRFQIKYNSGSKLTPNEYN